MSLPVVHSGSRISSASERGTRLERECCRRHGQADDCLQEASAGAAGAQAFCREKTTQNSRKAKPTIVKIETELKIEIAVKTD
eukprot:2772206-Pyramimonas_sp.AAC.1